MQNNRVLQQPPHHSVRAPQGQQQRHRVPIRRPLVIYLSSSSSEPSVGSTWTVPTAGIPFPFTQPEPFVDPLLVYVDWDNLSELSFDPEDEHETVNPIWTNYATNPDEPNLERFEEPPFKKIVEYPFHVKQESDSDISTELSFIVQQQIANNKKLKTE